METTEYKPTWKYYLLVWGGVTLLAGAQGWFTGESVMQVFEWVHQLSAAP